MFFIQPDKHTRRAFLRRSAQLAFTGAALPTALNLAALGEAAAFSATDYKALVCVFLFGGSDYANTVVTYDNTSYDRYAAIRGGNLDRTGGGIALAQSALTPTLLSPDVALPDGRQYALHPAMTGLAGLFNSGAAAVPLNVGPLVVPLTRQQYSGSDRVNYPLPPKLFSHNDQQSVWQSSESEGSSRGWGGRLGDLALASNSKSLFTCMSVTGNAVFLSGEQALSYQVSTGGAVNINSVQPGASVYGSRAVRDAMDQLVRQAGGHALQDEYNKVTTRAITSAADINAAMAAYPATAEPFVSFPAGNSLADQLKMVARLIAARSQLGAARQVFFVSLGGFDLHDNLIANQATLLGRLSAALTAFHSATVSLGVADKVTAFTASDFGRTLTSNGDGSDHGWGSHHFMVGGAVRGKAFYGAAPPVSVDNGTGAEDQWHVGQGRLLPSTAVDQYAATLAKWFGADNGEIHDVMPHLANFSLQDLGFLRAT